MSGAWVDEYEYLIVGGGTAGCRIAERLAAAGLGPIALVEAGPVAHDVRTVVPQWYVRLFGSNLDWSYRTEPVPGLGMRRIAWPRGRVVGGSGAINALIYLQAAAEDFQRWGWTWAERLGQRSLLDHQLPASPHPWSRAFVVACREMGLETLRTFDRSQPQSAGLFQTTQQRGRRVFAGQILGHAAAVEPLPKEPNRIVVIAHHTAETLLFRGGRAVGVAVRNPQGVSRPLTARREVIVSCGAVGTPLLLMKSGIGPAVELQRLGVRCRVESAGVGSNLQDHLAFPLIYATQRPESLLGCSGRLEREAYRQHGTGPLSSNIAEAGCLFALPTAQPSQHLGSIDCQIHFTPTHYLKHPRAPKGQGYCTLAITDLHPRSTGHLRWMDARREDGRVAIEPEYLGCEHDVSRMVRAIHFARELAQQPAFRSVIAHEELPGERRMSDDALRRALRAYAISMYHPVGTCRMETDAPGGTPAVVDRHFRLVGCLGLRIADASVLPDLPSGNTNAVTLLIAERLGDLLEQAG